MVVALRTFRLNQESGNYAVMESFFIKLGITSAFKYGCLRSCLLLTAMNVYAYMYVAFTGLLTNSKYADQIYMSEQTYR